MHKHLVRIALAALLTAFATAALAQQYPSRPIRIVVTIPPGGAPDIAARLIAQRLTETLGQAVVVENKSGANGNIAGDFVAKAAPDGYTLLLAADSLITINPHLYARITFDPLKDLVPVASIATNQFFLSINPALPVQTFQEFIEYARRANPPIPYASGGNGSQHQLGIEMLKQRAGIDMMHVPYRGGTPAGTATIAGETKVVLAGASSSGLLRSGQLRGLATTGKKRSPLFPDLPMIGEFYPGYEVTIWLALFAPSGTPAPILTKLRNEVSSALAQKELADKLNVTGALEPFSATSDELAALIRRDYEKYGKLVKDVGIVVVE